MAVFAGLVAWTIISYGLCRKMSARKANRYYCVMMCAALLLLQGLRSIYIGGVDTSLVYAVHYERIKSVAFADIADVFRKDLLFYYIMKLFSLTGIDFHVFVFVIAAFVQINYARFVYKYSASPMLSFIMYFALGYYAIGFQMLRHVVAVSVLLYSYEPLIKRKFVRFSLIVLLAACFHGSALVFLLAYPLVKIKINWKQWLAFALTLIMVFAARQSIQNLLNLVLSGMSRYANYRSNTVQLSLVGAVILLCVYIVSVFLSHPRYKTSAVLSTELNLSAISILFMMLVAVVGEFHRVSMFFGIFNTILLPRAWARNGAPASTRKIYMLAMVIVFAAYFLLIGLGNYDLMRYEFLWQDR